DYPQSTQADISAQSFLKIVDAHPSVVMFKHEDCPGLKKLTQIRKACDGVTRRYISILVGNGGLYVPQELARGADGIMTGFAYPEMLVSVFALFAAGRGDEAEDLFDVYLPLVRHEQQPGFGLAVRKAPEVAEAAEVRRNHAPFRRPGFPANRQGNQRGSHRNGRWRDNLACPRGSHTHPRFNFWPPASPVGGLFCRSLVERYSCRRTDVPEDI